MRGWLFKRTGKLAAYQVDVALFIILSVGFNPIALMLACFIARNWWTWMKNRSLPPFFPPVLIVAGILKCSWSPKSFLLASCPHDVITDARCFFRFSIWSLLWSAHCGEITLFVAFITSLPWCRTLWLGSFVMFSTVYVFITMRRWGMWIFGLAIFLLTCLSGFFPICS